LQSSNGTTSADNTIIHPSGTDLLSIITSTLDTNKAEDINVIDLKGKSSIADTMVIATGNSTRQVAALADYVSKAVKANNFGIPLIEGLNQADWVLLDAGSVIVHIFRPEVRTFYNLDKMWTTGLTEAEGSTEILN
jgi:ribosome-associated protein